MSDDTDKPVDTHVAHIPERWVQIVGRGTRKPAPKQDDAMKDPTPEQIRSAH